MTHSRVNQVDPEPAGPSRTDAVASQARLYASFARRLQALQVDAIVLMLAVALLFLIATTVGSETLSRLLGFGLLLAIVLYEPVLVATLGGTLGHVQRNLHVVDDRTGGRLGFGRAVARMVIKGALGWFSFLTMALTRRHQAVHDLATRSTVRIRDAQIARPSHFAMERAPAAAFEKRSFLRVGGVILLYEVALFAGAFALALILLQSDALSVACASHDRCGPGERIALDLFSMSILGLALCVVVLGLNGRLLGCRRKRLASAPL